MRRNRLWTEGKPCSGNYTKGDVIIANRNYTLYHCHSDYSLLDSATQFEDYVDLAVQNGQKTIASTEHGLPRGWVHKKLYCDEKGIKFIHGVEIYLTAELLQNGQKVRDNYHTVLLAKNYDGLLELNKLVSKSSDKEHFYYVNRISFDEFLNISPNIISTSACLASPLNKLTEESPYYAKYYEKLVQKYDYLEVQPHNHNKQQAFNEKLVALAEKYGKPLIAGTDTHSSTKYKAECRGVLLEAKNKSYGEEDAFDLTYKTYDELVSAFKAQGILSEDVYLQAIENTNVMADSVEDFELDKSFKYPILYGSREADEAKFKETVDTMFKEKCKKGIIPPEQKDAFQKAIDEEMRVFHKLGMEGFMLSESEIIRWCKSPIHGKNKDQPMAIGTARGSVGGSRVAYVTDIIDMNPETWGTNFARFCNEDRVSLGDIDTDCVEADRPEIFAHIIERFGADKTARVAAYSTLQEKSAIEDVCRALAKQWNEQHNAGTDNPYSLEKVKKIKDEYDKSPDEARKNNEKVFYYVDGLVGCKVSQSIHPAGIIISPVTLDDNYGVFDKDGERCLMLDMEEAHDVNLVKYDMLILGTVQKIRDACNLVGIPYPKTHEIDFNDKAVWADMRSDLTMIFQFESPYAQQSFRKFRTDSIYDMSMVTACIRPSGASYRDRLLARIPNKNPTKELDELLKNNLGYILYQEDTNKILQQVCGMTGSEADTIRRAISSKSKETIEDTIPKIVDGYCEHSSKPRNEAEDEAKAIVQVIEDSASYQFNYSHSVAYCILGYMCGYLRHYYPYEYITSFLNNAANEGDITNGTAYANKVGIQVTMPKFGISYSDYSFDKSRHIIAKGMSSIKYITPAVAKAIERTYKDRNNKAPQYFVDVLHALSHNAKVDSRVIDILMKIDFFSDFGNFNELTEIRNVYDDWFKKGKAKQISSKKVIGSSYERVIQSHCSCITKAGKEAANYTIYPDEMHIMLQEIEQIIKAEHKPDISVQEKIQNCQKTMGYYSYSTGKEEDRRKIYVVDERPVAKRGEAPFAHVIKGKSIGSGKESEYTIYNRVYDRIPIHKGDIIFAQNVNKNARGYWVLNGYQHLQKV